MPPLRQDGNAINNLSNIHSSFLLLWEKVLFCCLLMAQGRVTLSPSSKTNPGGAILIASDNLGMGMWLDRPFLL